MPLPDLLRSPRRDLLPPMQNQQPLSVLLDASQIVGDHRHGASPAAEPPQLAPELSPALGVEAGGGLVQQQHGGLVLESQGQAQTLPLPSRTGAHGAIQKAPQL